MRMLMNSLPSWYALYQWQKCVLLKQQYWHFLKISKENKLEVVSIGTSFNVILHLS